MEEAGSRCITSSRGRRRGIMRIIAVMVGEDMEEEGMGRGREGWERGFVRGCWGRWLVVVVWIS